VNGTLQALYGGGLGGSGLTNTAAFSINNTQHQLAMLAARGSLDPSSLAAFASMNAVGGSMQVGRAHLLSGSQTVRGV
jgi:hypothetical protein